MKTVVGSVLVLLVAGILVFPGCFRSLWLGMQNENLEGETAPALTGDGWVRPDGATEAVSRKDKWTLLVFFLPT